MTLLYLDTNALLKLVLQEPGSERVEQLVSEIGSLCTSIITYAEARATIARHFAEKSRLAGGSEEASARLAAEHQEVITDFNALWDDVNVVDVTPEISFLAGDLTVAHAGLRGMDALQLAAAVYVHRTVPLTFMTFDDRLRKAAIAILGFKIAG